MYAIKITAVCDFEKQPAQMRGFPQLFPMPDYMLNKKDIEVLANDSKAQVIRYTPKSYVAGTLYEPQTIAPVGIMCV